MCHNLLSTVAKLALILKATVASKWFTMNAHMAKNEVNIFDITDLYKAKKYTKKSQANITGSGRKLASV